MAKRRESFVHEWFDLVDKSGLVISEPVLHVHFPVGPEPVGRRAARALLGSWERFLVDRLDAARRARWTEAVLFDLLGWPRERFCGRREVPEELWFRPDEVEETLRPSGVLQGDLPIKALDGPFGEEGDLEAALDYLILNPDFADIVNMSLANYQQTSGLQSALSALAQSAILIGGSGNTGIPGHADIGYPESHPDVITVAGTDATDARASFSDSGNSVEFAAPAVDIYTASWSDPFDFNAAHVGPGTSFAAPMVAGIAALRMSMSPDTTASDLVAALRATAVDLGPPGWDPEFGWGRVNAYQALIVIFSDGFEAGDFTAWDSSSP